MRQQVSPWRTPTTLGFVPPLVLLLVADLLLFLVSSAWIWNLRLDTEQISLGNLVADLWFGGVLSVAFSVWVFGVVRGWTTAATGGGFVVAAAALGLRTLAELPVSGVQIPASVLPPPEPYGTVLALARVGGIACIVMGLSFVMAAVLSERWLRRRAPSWAPFS